MATAYTALRLTPPESSTLTPPALYQHPEVEHTYEPYTYAYPPNSKPPAPAPSSSKLHTAQARAARRSVVLPTCLTATLILASLLATTAALLTYLCAFNACRVVPARRALVSTAPLGRVLTITQVTSHVAPVSVPVVMGLFSYLLAAGWLRSSAVVKDGDASNGNGNVNRPTPMQLSLLMSICNGANLRRGALLVSVKYMFSRRPSDASAAATEREARATPLLRRAVVTLGSLLATSYLIAAADTWLHASSTSVVIPSSIPYTPTASSNSTNPNNNAPSQPAFARAINATMCAAAASSAAGYPDTLKQIVTGSCGVLSIKSTGSGRTLAEGIRVLTNNSALHSVAFADDQTAILVPASIPPNVTYQARTLGVRTQCATLGLSGIGTGQEFGVDYGSSPFSTGEVVTSNAYLDPDQPLDTFIGNTGWFVHGNTGAWNVVVCNTTALDVTYTYHPPSSSSSSPGAQFIMQHASLASTTDTQHIMAAAFAGQTTAVSRAVDGAGTIDGHGGVTYEQVYALQLARYALAAGGFMYEPREVDFIRLQDDIVGAELQIAALALFLAAVLVFACQVIWYTTSIIIHTSRTRFVGLAALHLSNPLTAVQTSYGRTAPEMTWNSDVTKRFGVETERDRLCVGPVYMGELDEMGLGSEVFAVTRG
uniref:Uncharacterized protein n=1 Tax=Psilocybe cubensis TaxID=181762 RepID=A0A8H7XTX3_PSICU